MATDKKSRAFDPTYVPTKTYQDLEKEQPDNPGIKMMADRERKLTNHTGRRPVPKPLMSPRQFLKAAKLVHARRQSQSDQAQAAKAGHGPSLSLLEGPTPVSMVAARP